VTIPLDPTWISIFDVASHSWKLLPGNYGVAVGGASDAIAVWVSLKL
jgi:hypothetical protein